MTQGPVEQLCTASILNLPWLLLVWLRGLSDQFCTYGRASFFPGKWPLELINCGEIGHHPTLNKDYFSKAQRLRHHPGLHATNMDFSSPAAAFLLPQQPLPQKFRKGCAYFAPFRKFLASKRDSTCQRFDSPIEFCNKPHPIRYASWDV